MSEENNNIQETVPDGATPKEAPHQETLKEVLVSQAHEGEHIAPSKLNLKKILGGDIFNTQFMRRQIYLILLIVAFVIVYISNRYTVQKDLIEIDKLRTELQDAKYRTLSSSSKITEKSRESKVIEALQTNQDSVLKIPAQPPFIVNIPETDR